MVNGDQAAQQSLILILSLSSDPRLKSLEMGYHPIRLELSPMIDIVAKVQALTIDDSRKYSKCFSRERSGKLNIEV